jgi:hypothetical protein
MLGWFKLEVETIQASAMGVAGNKSALLVQLCRALGATTYLSGPSGVDYLEEALFHAAGIDVIYEHFEHPIYPQRGRNQFVSHLSALDALANLGAASRALVVPTVSDIERPAQVTA